MGLQGSQEKTEGNVNLEDLLEGFVGEEKEMWEI